MLFPLNRSTLAGLLLILGAGASAMAQGVPPPTSGPTTTPSAWAPEVYPISFWCGPPPQFVTGERYRQIADAGFNYVMPSCSGGGTPTDNKRVLDTAQQSGLKAFVSDNRMPMAVGGNAGARQALDAIVADYAAHPALAGYFIADEPGPGAYRGLGEVVAYLREKDAAHVAYINLLPNYAPAWAIGPSYDEYIDGYIRIVKPFAVSYDHYHFTKTGDGPLFFDNLDAVRRVCLQRGDVPFWNIVLAIPHGGYRRLTEAEKRFEAMQTLAFGGKGLMFFTYWQPAADGAWGPAIINFDGSPTPQYEEVKHINHDVQAIGKYLLRATSTGVSAVVQGGTTRAASRPDSGILTLGTFQAGATGYALAASRNYREEISIDIALPTAGMTVERLEKSADRWEPVASRPTTGEPAGAIVRVKLAPGDGELLRWK